jgi:N-acetylglucosamine-6-sulfatase
MVFSSTSLFATAVAAAAAKQPHLVVILTDDQDLTLGSMQAMPKLQKLVVDQGVTFEQAFIATPICCPSRASYISGRYQHNHRCLQNSVHAGCNSAEWRNTTEKDSVAPHVQAQGYTTFYAGKYLNAYGALDAGGLAHVPPGWDSWLGLQGNSRYYNYSVHVCITARSVHLCRTATHPRPCSYGPRLFARRCRATARRRSTATTTARITSPTS